MSTHTGLQATLAKLLKELPKVVKLDPNTYVINGVVSRKLKHGWLLKSPMAPEGITVIHPKAGVILPWVLNEPSARSLCDRILSLDKIYGFMVFEVENQRRLIGKYQQTKDFDSVLVHVTKLNLAKDKARRLNNEIQNNLARIKFAK
jgi:hypothetical protein